MVAELGREVKPIVEGGGLRMRVYVDEALDREAGLKPAVLKIPVPGDHGLKPVAKRGCRLKAGRKD